MATAIALADASLCGFPPNEPFQRKSAPKEAAATFSLPLSHCRFALKVRLRRYTPVCAADLKSDFFNRLKPPYGWLYESELMLARSRGMDDFVEQVNQLDAILRAAGIPAHGFCAYEAALPLLPCRAAARLPKHPRSIIMCLFPYYTGEYPGRNVARYAVSADYHHIAGAMLAQAAARLSEAFPGHSFAAFADAGPIREVEAARLAGLGFVGRNGQLITEEYGSYCFLGELVTDLPLPPSVPLERECLGCGKCLAACPHGALGGASAADTLCGNAVACEASASGEAAFCGGSAIREAAFCGGSASREAVSCGGSATVKTPPYGNNTSGEAAFCGGSAIREAAPCEASATVKTLAYDNSAPREVGFCGDGAAGEAAPCEAGTSGERAGWGKNAAVEHAPLILELCRSHFSQKKGALSDWERASLCAGGLAWGCDLCTDSCPHNHTPKRTPIRAFYEEPVPVLTEEACRALCKTRAYGYRGAAVPLRNLAVLREGRAANEQESIEKGDET